MTPPRPRDSFQTASGTSAHRHVVEVVVARLGLDSTTQSYVLVLQEKGGTRLLPIWIGQPEAESIVMQRSEEHTSELQSRRDLVCRLLLEKKKKKKRQHHKTTEK